MKNVAQRNTIRNSIEKIDSYLQKKEDFVAITTISLDLNLHSRSVKKCIETLNKLNRIEIATNGNVILVRAKKVESDINARRN